VTAVEAKPLRGRARTIIAGCGSQSKFRATIGRSGSPSAANSVQPKGGMAASAAHSARAATFGSPSPSTVGLLPHQSIWYVGWSSMRATDASERCRSALDWAIRSGSADALPERVSGRSGARTVRASIRLHCTPRAR
jgi:hypothetical protein